MQGFLTLPYRCEYQWQVYVSTSFDLDPAPGTVRNWRRDTTVGDCNWVIVVEGTCDDHFGIDYIMPTGIPTVAAAPGNVNYADTLPNGALNVTLDHLVGGNRLQTGYGHLSEILVGRGEFVPRGQIIGLSGGTGLTGPHPPSQIEHLHFALYDATEGRQHPPEIDPYRDVLDSGSLGYWTVDNNPQCLP
jgi:murein DD-endopeptidase MepM/ murein hydrolase activator NlpD